MFVLQIRSQGSEPFSTTHDMFLNKTVKKQVKRHQALLSELEHYKYNPSQVTSEESSYYQTLTTDLQNRANTLTTEIANNTTS